MTILDELHIFGVGDKVTAQETNDNNKTLESWIRDRSDITAYINSKVEEINNQYSGQISSINTQLSSLNNQISGLSKLDSLKFKKNIENLGVGKTSLASYLPNDGKEYLVWVWAKLYSSTSGDNEYETIETDKMTSDYRYIQADGDSGRASRASAFVVVPVGTGRYIKITQKSDHLTVTRKIYGYCRI
jgi:hypothetical protein